MGFNEKWINLVMVCVKIVTYSILVNGELCGMIRTSPRPRQLRPGPKAPTTKFFYPLQKRPHVIVKGRKFYKKYDFFQIVVHFLLLVMLGISQILLYIYKLTCYQSQKRILNIH